MTRLVVILLVGLVLEAFGVVLISKGQKQITGPQGWSAGEVLRVAREGVTNRHIVAGVALEAGFFACLLFLMAHADISFVWPLTSLSFVMTTLAARWILHEQVSAARWGGVALILVGASVVAYTERARGPGTPPAADGTRAATAAGHPDR